MSLVSRSFRDRAVKAVFNAIAAATPRGPRPRERATIGIFMFWGIGDAVLTTPFLRALRAAAPAARIVAIGKPFLAPLFGEEGLIDEYVDFVPPWTRHHGKYRLWSPGWRSFAAQVRTLRRRRFDLLISLRPDPRETALARVLAAGEFAGYADAGGAGWIDTDLSRGVADEANVYRGELAAIAAEHLFGTRPSADPNLRLLGTPPALVNQLIAAGYREGPVLAVAFGAAHPIRRWSAEKISATLASVRHPPGAYLLIDGDDSPRVEAPQNAPSVRWRGPLNELRHALSAADVLFCSDSGTMHIASALDCRVVAVFGPGSLGRFAPRAPQHAVYAVEPMPCRPCYDSCIYSSPRCMDQIDTNAVAANLEKSLAAVKRPRIAIKQRMAV